MEFRLLWAVQLKSCLPLSKSCYFNVLGQGQAADANQTVLWKWPKLCYENRYAQQS